MSLDLIKTFTMRGSLYMFKKSGLFFIYTETPTHVGSGAELGYVDLPIQREKHSGFPKIEASGLKGSLREIFENDHKLKGYVTYVFGPESGDLHSGAIGFLDARILLFPVKSAKGIFGWVTCPYVLSRFKEELSACGINYVQDKLKDIDKVKENSFIQDSNLLLKNSGSESNEDIVIFEEYSFNVNKNDTLKNFAEWLAENVFPKPEDSSNDLYKVFRKKMKKDIVVIPDDDFSDFTEMYTEVITRTKIGKNGTVEDRALFNEEYIPENAVFYSIALASRLFVDNEERKKINDLNKFNTDEEFVLDYFQRGIKSHGVIQIGGNATIGKGIVRIVDVKGEKCNE